MYITQKQPKKRLIPSLKNNDGEQLKKMMSPTCWLFIKSSTILRQTPLSITAWILSLGPEELLWLQQDVLQWYVVKYCHDYNNVCFHDKSWKNVKVTTSCVSMISGVQIGQPTITEIWKSPARVRQHISIVVEQETGEHRQSRRNLSQR